MQSVEQDRDVSREIKVPNMLSLDETLFLENIMHFYRYVLMGLLCGRD